MAALEGKVGKRYAGPDAVAIGVTGVPATGSYAYSVTLIDAEPVVPEPQIKRFADVRRYRPGPHVESVSGNEKTIPARPSVATTFVEIEPTAPPVLSMTT